jgi:hypothetical protein
MRLTVALLLSLLLIGPASAQSLYGPGGLFLHPTASLPPKGQLTPSLLLLPQHDPEDHVTRTWISGSLDYGLLRDLEIGGTVLKVTAWNRDPSGGGYFKYRFLRESATRPAMAFGFTGLGGGDVDTRIAFLALKKGFGAAGRHPITAHLGVQYADVVDGFSKHEFQPYAGVELGLTSRLSFIAEGRPRMSQEFGTPLALTLSYRVSRRWHLAVTWANNGRSDEPRFGFGAGLSLGSR